jgi:DNA-binding MarR family transcriptional regulator
MSPADVVERPLDQESAWDSRLIELGLAFRKIFRALNGMRGRDTHLGGSELSHAQFQLLMELEEQGELSAGELATAAQLAPGTVSEMLDGLAESGHVERDRSRSDRRVVVSRLTPLGRRRIEAKRAAWKARWEQALDGVPEKDLRAATRVLERLAEMFADTPAKGASEGSPATPRTSRKPG